MSARTPSSNTGGLSRAPYLPGLDGLRAIAVVAVILYHANHNWLSGGFLGVEVFFVISGYLITLLLLGEHERSGFIDFGRFWLRRARRLLPALFVMMAGVLVYITAFYPETRWSTRGDFLAGIFYVSNWYQIWVGQGYAASEAFVPLRHLWSLAVEEQFYIVWPLVMAAVLRRRRRSLPSVGLMFIGISLIITAIVAALFVSGPVSITCNSVEGSKTGCWQLGGHWMSVNETLYLGSISRSAGLLLGAGFAMLWRPMAIIRGPLRTKGRMLDVIAAFGLLFLVYWFFTRYVFERGVYDPWTFRGGFFLTGVATLMVIAAVTHQFAATGKLLGNRAFLWAGTRSYGLYLYHWPIFQIIRKQALIPLSFPQFVVGMAFTVGIAEWSYRFVETPIRTGHGRELWQQLTSTTWRKVAAVAVALMLALGVTSMVVADYQCVGKVACNSVVDDTDSTTPTTPATNPSVVPGDTTASTAATTTTIPFDPEPYIAIGESVMAGAAPQLQQGGVYVNARENRSGEGVKNTILQLEQEGRLVTGSAITIQVGTNGPVSDSELAAIIDALPADVGPVYFMTVHGDLEWVAGNNERIRALPATYPVVTGIIDWDAEAANVDLCPDGVHISCNGTGPATYYSNLILGAFGLPLLPMP